MELKWLTFFIFLASLVGSLSAEPANLQSYLLPKDHPLQKQLPHLLKNPLMFNSPLHLNKAGFQVKSGHNFLMVAQHYSLKKYLIKKFQKCRSEESQLENYVRRIKGANQLRNLIKAHHFKNLKVPQKWLYKLPEKFSKNGYILIVENMNICREKENRHRYHKISKQKLKELCVILHETQGCDAYPRNQPFTKSGKIAFIDTEHVGHMKDAFLSKIVPHLDSKRRKYARYLWKKLESKGQLNRKVIPPFSCKSEKTPSQIHLCDIFSNYLNPHYCVSLDDAI